MIIRALLACLVAVAATLLSPAASAQTLFAATGSNGVDADLYRINPATGGATLVGPVLVGALPVSLTGLAAHPTTGVLYGVSHGNSANFDRSLFTINTATGAATVIGGVGDTLGGTTSDISFSPSGTLFGYRPNTDELVTINLTTGVATVVGVTGTGNSCGGSIAFVGATLFAAKLDDAGNLERLNTATGVATAGPLLTGAPAGFGCLPAIAANGAQLFGVDSDTGGVALTTLVRINTVTGAITNIGALPDDIDALAFAAAAGAPARVPTLSEWALILLALTIAGFGMGAAARRR